MQIYRTFLYIEEYIVSNLPYRVSRYFQNQWFFCLFSSKNFRKFPENSENPWTKVLNNNNNGKNSKNLPKILKFCRKFSENSLKRRSFWGPNIVSISYRIEKKTLISYWYRIESKKNLSLFIDSVVKRGVPFTMPWRAFQTRLLSAFPDSKSFDVNPPSSTGEMPTNLQTILRMPGPPRKPCFQPPVARSSQEKPLERGQPGWLEVCL